MKTVIPCWQTEYTLISTMATYVMNGYSLNTGDLLWTNTLTGANGATPNAYDDYGIQDIVDSKRPNYLIRLRRRHMGCQHANRHSHMVHKHNNYYRAAAELKLPTVSGQSGSSTTDVIGQVKTT